MDVSSLTIDQQIAFWSAFGSIVSAVTALLTTAIAAFVFVEARKIRRLEWATTAIQNWQAFNQLVLTSGAQERWGAIIDGRLSWEELNQADRTIVYSFLNVLLFEHNAQGNGLLAPTYAEKSIGQNATYLRPVWPALHTHLQQDGWPADFVEALHLMISRLPEWRPTPLNENTKVPSAHGDRDEKAG